ncbi:hypothetical protein ZIOFF_070392 [Zingiber officinale]|uniref:ABC transmembrane type-1 domain-containing protein n=1 Tax=Zingiber officinale TaxID=94328 RepID=A0A8J5CEY9_ZINOF|nr:hypothetical protein ZIOFF_070392 [Zingiber officinale]
MAFFVWFGSRMYNGGKGGTVFAVSNSIIFDGFISEAISAGERILEVIRRVPKIDSGSSNGEALENLSGGMEFRNVEFAYPSRTTTYFGLQPQCASRAECGISGSGFSVNILVVIAEDLPILSKYKPISSIKLKYSMSTCCSTPVKMSSLVFTSFLSFQSIFSHGDMVDTLLMILGFVGAVGDGLAIPAFFMFTRVIFNDIGQGSIEALLSIQNVIYLVYLAGGSFLASFMEGYCWSRTGERQASRMQAQYLTAVLRQDVEYFDLNAGTSSEVITSITSDSLVIEDCLSKKVPNFIMNRATLVGCYAGGFSMMWRLALVGSPTAVLLVIPGILYGHILMELARKVRREYQKADTVVEQCVSSINTVYSFVEEERTIAKFSATLDDSVKLGLHQGLTKGLAVGSNGIIFAIMAFLVWFGSHIIMYNGGKGGTVFAISNSIHEKLYLFLSYINCIVLCETYLCINLMKNYDSL